jgi:preprotein translocase subunit SecA
MSIFKKIFGSKNEREIRRLIPRVQAINALESKIKALSDDELRAKTAELKTKVQDNGAPLDEVLHEAFAMVREAGWRAVKMRHFDVQLIGGMVLHSGKIAEMRTGEGKTLVATLPAYLNALSGKGVHVVTVNDYLANRDAEWMGKIYRFLGLTVGTIVHGFDDDHKQRQYGCDITYGTNSEYGFDYLRDNMKFSLSEYTQQRGQNFAIIDEVDSVLVDEARTPLIISGPAEESTERYIEANRIVSKLRIERDYTVDEKSKFAVLTDEGTDHVEKMLKVGNLYSPENLEWLHHITKALQAHACYKRDVEYLIQDGEVLIIDEHTGRTMPGRRWSDGLHQAIEAKEGVKIQRENMTLATITYQNFYRMYNKLSGMTGTADTEAEEFHKIYKLDVVVIPTNKAMIRKDADDLVYKTEAEKFAAVVEDIKERHGRGQPVLVGTKSVDKSEVVSRLLKKHEIPHTILNAKFHRQEGEIIAQAGRHGAVTISTNMAGRGTDILLGGNPEYLARAAVAHEELGESRDPEREQRVLAEFRWLSGSPESIPIETLTSDYTDRKWREKVSSGEIKPGEEGFDFATMRKSVRDEARAYLEKLIARYKHHLEHFDRECQEAKKKVLEAGGLHVLGTERHESRRIDNQLRGRSGRQGDPGSSHFYLSLEDDLMRLFGGDKLVGMMERLGMEDGVPIEARMVSKSIEGAQRRVEGHNFDIRKNLIEYDDVLSQQRKSVYSLRRRVLGHDDMSEDVLDMMERVVLVSVGRTCSRKVAPDEWRIDDLKALSNALFGVSVLEGKDPFAMRVDEIEEEVYVAAEKRWKKKQEDLDARFCVVDEHLLPKERMPALAKITEPVWRYLLRHIYLRELDAHWREHLTQMDHLKEGIHLRGYGQRDPKLEYKREGFQLFDSMLSEIDHNVIEKLFHVEVVSSEAVEREAERQRRASEAIARAAELAGGGQDQEAVSDAVSTPSAAASRPADGDGEGGGLPSRPSAAPAPAKRPGRNDPCWCGSGKKYKKCHLDEDEKARASA